MDYVKQFCIIMVVYFLGIVLSLILPLPIPSAIWGFVLMFALLCTKVIKINKVERAGDFLIRCFPIIYLYNGTHIIQTFMALGKDLIFVLAISLIGLVVCALSAGLCTQYVCKALQKRRESGIDE